jgi:hypothetical protein
MTEFTEPVWVGMDVEAELARMQERERSEHRGPAAGEEAGGTRNAPTTLHVPPELMGRRAAIAAPRLAI